MRTRAEESRLDLDDEVDGERLRDDVELTDTDDAELVLAAAGCCCDCCIGGS